MALRYLLDTNMLSDLIRHPQGTVANRIASVGENTVCTGIVVAAELRYGAEKSTSRKIADRVDLILNALNVLPAGIPGRSDLCANPTSIDGARRAHRA